MEKFDLKRKWKYLYHPDADRLEVVDVPPFQYLMVDGEGDPNTTPAFQEAVEALYALSYELKFSMKKSPNPKDWSVMPLEGLWWTDETREFQEIPKERWKWTVMILQPDFVTQEQMKAAVEAVRKKKKPAALDKVRLGRLAEGRAVQTLYIGPFSSERQTIERMHQFIHSNGKELRGRHHEIYLSDPRRTPETKLRTVLRQPMQ